MSPLTNPPDTLLGVPANWPVSGEFGRRDFLQWLGATLALAGLFGCTKQPRETIVPYVVPPSAELRGNPVYYATAVMRQGLAVGVLAETHEGRPTKLEGNPEHPASLGATDPFVQAAVWSLYDPGRSQAILHQGRQSDWRQFLTAARALRSRLAATQGAGLALLTPPLSSPSMIRRLTSFLRAYPQARWFTSEPPGAGNVEAGMQLAWGLAARPVHRFERARVLALLDADALYGGPDSIANAMQWARGRRQWRAAGRPQRMYVWESAPTVTGTRADVRTALRSGDIAPLAAAMARALGIRQAAGAPPVAAHVWRQAVDDLLAARGESVVVAGERQPPAVHALAALMNHALGNIGTTVHYIAPQLARGEPETGLGEALAAGQIETLIVAGVNPAYDAPDIFARLSKTRTILHLDVYKDETGSAAHWHLPAAHPFETWGDARAFDGTAAITQPLIEPLFDGRGLDDVLDALEAKPHAGAFGRVRAFWQDAWGADFESRWPEALSQGKIAGAAPALEIQPTATPVVLPAMERGLEINFRPDPTVGHGEFAENAWLQELPKPISKVTWGNGVWLSPKTAKHLDINNGEHLTVSNSVRKVTGPAIVVAGHADEAVTLFWGNGRSTVHAVAAQRGYNAYLLSGGAEGKSFQAGSAVKSPGYTVLPSTQGHHRMEGRDLAKTVSEGAKPFPGPKAPGNLFPSRPLGAHAWAMLIDLDTCIGCGACTVACQAENNIPVVGPAEVALGREMHWIRIDQYVTETPGQGATYVNQPVPCMHCENAPCELVCPVEATVHDSEGVNEMIYNRCIGTRYCSNNCPYKVRRFNFFAYADSNEELPKMQRNPQVTVRSRGVMEKCTYCIQRIEAARIQAGVEGRPMRDGDVVTACQAACPTEAILFGDLADPKSRLAVARTSGRHYVLLEELQTQPRTTYWAAVRNSPGKGS